MAKESKRRILMLKCGLVLLILTFVTGILLVTALPAIIRYEIYKQMQIKEGSFVFNAWKAPPFPLYFEFYFFDVLNKEEVIQNGAKIAVQQKGPYTYRLFSDKTNITFNDNGTVSYRYPTKYTFELDKSVGPDTDLITTVNFILVTITTNIKDEYEFVKKMTVDFFDAIGANRPFVERSVHDILWGFEDDILKRVKEVMTPLGIPFDDHFGFFYQLNNSQNGLWNVNTGEKDHDTMFEINFWNGNRTIPYWTSKYCNTIRGTDGNMFHPYQTKETEPTFFFEELCRNIYVTYDSEETIKGVHSYRYTQPPKVFENPTKNPENKGYCTPAGDCLPSGLYNMSKCRKGSPFSMSLPHFLFADDDVVNGVEGLHPNIRLHQPFVNIVPEIGAVIATERKYQVNMYIQKTPWVKALSTIDDVNFPVFWFNQSTILNEHWAHFIVHSFQTPLAALPWIGYTFLVVGFLGSCILVFVLWRRRKHSQRRTAIEEEEDKVINEGCERTFLKHPRDSYDDTSRGHRNGSTSSQ